MSCASPIQASPPSLRMYIDGNNLLSPCRPGLEDSPFSFAFPRSSAPPSSTSPAAGKSRSVLADIMPQISPQSPLCRSAALLSPRKRSKENRGVGPNSNGSSQGSCSSPGKFWDSANQNFPSSHEWGKEDQDVGRKSPKLCAAELPKSCRRDDQIAAIKPTLCDAQGGPVVNAFDCSPSPSPLKRKRPAKLFIPEFARLSSFSKLKQFEVPAGEPPSSEILTLESPLFGVSYKKGHRDVMEDAYTALTNFQGIAKQTFFGVFDGHGGKSAAQFAAENLGRHIAREIECQSHGKRCLESAMKAGYLAMDSEFLQKGLGSGACSVSAYVKEGHLVVANAGDCKAVLCREGKAEALSNMHRPSNADERQRIENLGGYVDLFSGVWRVQGTLAVTRGFGDTNLKTWISAEPDVRQIDITEDCEFLILASDGLWDKVNDQEAVDCVRKSLEQVKQEALVDSPPISSRPCKVIRTDSVTSIHGTVTEMEKCAVGAAKADACVKLIHKACSRGNLDDITVMVVPLASFVPGPCAQGYV